MPLSDRDSLGALAYLFVTFGHATDGSLGMDEMRTLASRLTARAGGGDLETVGALIKQAVGDYKAQPTMGDKLARAQQCVDTLRAHGSDEDVRGVLDDLREIAGADGTVSPEEEEFIATVAAALGQG